METKETGITRQAVVEAASRLRPYIHRTPILRCKSLNEMAGAELFFKCENFQKTGAFKARGALNAVLGLDNDVTAVVTHSSGNHGAALAWAARQQGLDCHVVIPEDASPFKRENTARYGASLIDCGAELDSRESTLEDFLGSNSAKFISPYDDPAIVAGQGTAALELIKRVSGLDQIWVPVGGGGLATGTIIAAQGELGVVCGEPELADDAFESMATGKRQPPRPPRTIADGLRSSLGDIAFQTLYETKTPIVLVSDQEILDATRLIWEHMKIVVEPSSAVPLAAVLRYPDMVRNRVGIILSGGNVAFAFPNEPIKN